MLDRMKTMMNFERYQEKYKFLAIFLCALFLCSFFPYSGDDWGWGTKWGIEKLENKFNGYNGRYVGNLIVLALTRVRTLRNLVMAVVLTLIIWCIYKITNKQKGSLVIILLSITLMPVELFRQTIVWTSGFSNYSISALCVLLYVAYTVDFIFSKEIKQSWLMILPMILLGFVSCQLLENISLYMVTYGACIIAWSIVRERKVYVQHVAYFIGAVVGNILMFTNKCYGLFGDAGDSTRNVAGMGEFSVIEKAVANIVNVIMSHGFINNTFLNVIILGLCGLIYKTSKVELTPIKQKLARLALIFIGIYTAISIIIRISPAKIGDDIAYNVSFLIVELLLVFLFLVSIIIFTLFILQNYIQKMKIVFWYANILVLSLPLLVVPYVKLRCAFHIYIFSVMVIIELYRSLPDYIKRAYEMVSKYMGILLVAGYMYLSYIYITITMADNERIAQLKEDLKDYQPNQTTQIVKVVRLPYYNYVWCSTPKANDFNWITKYIMFYDINDTIENLSNFKFDNEVNNKKTSTMSQEIQYEYKNDKRYIEIPGVEIEITDEKPIDIKKIQKERKENGAK